MKKVRFLLSFILLLVLLPSSEAKYDLEGICSCWKQWHPGSTDGFYMHYSYWGNFNCSVAYGYIFTDYYMVSGNGSNWMYMNSGYVSQGVGGSEFAHCQGMSPQ